MERTRSCGHKKGDGPQRKDGCTICAAEGKARLDAADKAYMKTKTMEALFERSQHPYQSRNMFARSNPEVFSEIRRADNLPSIAQPQFRFAYVPPGSDSSICATPISLVSPSKHLTVDHSVEYLYVNGKLHRISQENVSSLPPLHPLSPAHKRVSSTCKCYSKYGRKGKGGHGRHDLYDVYCTCGDASRDCRSLKHRNCSYPGKHHVDSDNESTSSYNSYSTSSSASSNSDTHKNRPGISHKKSRMQRREEHSHFTSDSMSSSTSSLEHSRRRRKERKSKLPSKSQKKKEKRKTKEAKKQALSNELRGDNSSHVQRSQDSVSYTMMMGPDGQTTFPIGAVGKTVKPASGPVTSGESFVSSIGLSLAPSSSIEPARTHSHIYTQTDFYFDKSCQTSTGHIANADLIDSLETTHLDQSHESRETDINEIAERVLHLLQGKLHPASPVRRAVLPKTYREVACGDDVSELALQSKPSDLRRRLLDRYFPDGKLDFEAMPPELRDFLRGKPVGVVLVRDKRANSYIAKEGRRKNRDRDAAAAAGMIDSDCRGSSSSSAYSSEHCDCEFSFGQPHDKTTMARPDDIDRVLRGTDLVSQELELVALIDAFREAQAVEMKQLRRQQEDKQNEDREAVEEAERAARAKIAASEDSAWAAVRADESTARTAQEAYERVAREIAEADACAKDQQRREDAQARKDVVAAEEAQRADISSAECSTRGNLWQFFEEGTRAAADAERMRVAEEQSIERERRRLTQEAREREEAERKTREKAEEEAKAREDAARLADEFERLFNDLIAMEEDARLSLEDEEDAYGALIEEEAEDSRVVVEALEEERVLKQRREEEEELERQRQWEEATRRQAEADSAAAEEERKRRRSTVRMSGLIPNQRMAETTDGKLKLIGDSNVERVEEHQRERARAQRSRSLRQQSSLSSAGSQESHGARRESNSSLTPRRVRGFSTSSNPISGTRGGSAVSGHNVDILPKILAVKRVNRSEPSSNSAPRSDSEYIHVLGQLYAGTPGSRTSSVSSPYPSLSNLR